jgi:putative transposase
VNFITAHKEVFGVEPVCEVLRSLGLRIAPSTYYAVLSRPRSSREIEDERLTKLIQEIYEDNYSVYGTKKMWHELHRRSEQVGRGRVERLMRQAAIVGAVRGPRLRTTVRDDDAERADDLVRRQFVAGAPNRLWVADFTEVPTRGGAVYVAVIVDVFSRRIPAWKAATTKETSLITDTLAEAIGDRSYRSSSEETKLIHHSDAGSQYTSLKFAGHLQQAGIQPSIGTVGDALDNALAESTIGLYKTELIKPRGPWYGLQDVELATELWVSWYNTERLHSACGYRPPAEFEALYETGDLTRLVARHT